MTKKSLSTIKRIIVMIVPKELETILNETLLFVNNLIINDVNDDYKINTIELDLED